MNHVCLIQITDTHLYSDINEEFLGVNPYVSLKVVLNTIQHRKISPELFILTGDLSQDGTRASYEYIADALSNFDVPCYVVPGNHDNPEVISSVYPRGNIKNQKHIILPHWQIILLDSQKAGCVEGHLSGTQLDFLTNCLLEQQKLPAIIMLHHPAWTIACDWIDPLRLDNSDEFWEICKNQNHVKAVLSGHVHQQYSTKINHIECFSTPSTSIQFKPNSHYFTLEDKPQGYRIIKLYDDGEIRTEVCRVENYVGKFLRDATGY